MTEPVRTSEAQRVISIYQSAELGLYLGGLLLGASMYRNLGLAFGGLTFALMVGAGLFCRMRRSVFEERQRKAVLGKAKERLGKRSKGRRRRVAA